MTKRKIGVLGAGTWGMALARMLTVSGNEVQVWSAIEAEVDNLSTTRVHPNLPGMKIPAELQFTKSIEEVCTGKDVLLFAVPSVFVRGTTAKARPYIPDGQILVDVAKGMEAGYAYDPHRGDRRGDGTDAGKTPRLVALSGPTHAEEVARDLPTTIVSASPDAQAAALCAGCVHDRPPARLHERGYHAAWKLAGALKNVIALARGHRRRPRLRRQRPRRHHHPRHRRNGAPRRGHGLHQRDLQRASPALATWWSPATSMHSRNNRCRHAHRPGRRPGRRP